MFDLLDLFSPDMWVDKPGKWLWRFALLTVVLIGLGYLLLENDLTNIGAGLVFFGLVPLILAAVFLIQILWRWLVTACVWAYHGLTGRPR